MSCKKVFVAAEQLAVPGPKASTTTLTALSLYLPTAHLLQRNQAGRVTTNKAPMLSASLVVSRLGGLVDQALRNSTKRRGAESDVSRRKVHICGIVIG
jgi:hypothetical protein